MKHQSFILIAAVLFIRSGRLSAQILFTSDTSVYLTNYMTGINSLVLNLPNDEGAGGIVQDPGGEIYVGTDTAGAIYTFTLGSPIPVPFVALSQGVEAMSMTPMGISLSQEAQEGFSW